MTNEEMTAAEPTKEQLYDRRENALTELQRAERLARAIMKTFDERVDTSEWKWLEDLVAKVRVAQEEYRLASSLYWDAITKRVEGQK